MSAKLFQSLIQAYHNRVLRQPLYFTRIENGRVTHYCCIHKRRKGERGGERTDRKTDKRGEGERSGERIQRMIDIRGKGQSSGNRTERKADIRGEGHRSGED